MVVLHNNSLQFYRDLYPKGTRIRILSMPNKENPVPTNTIGTIKSVEETGHIFVDWDNGQTEPIQLGVDQFKPLDSEKIYSP